MLGGQVCYLPSQYFSLPNGLGVSQYFSLPNGLGVSQYFLLEDYGWLSPSTYSSINMCSPSNTA